MTNLADDRQLGALRESSPEQRWLPGCLSKLRPQTFPGRNNAAWGEPVTSGSQVVMAIQTPIAGASHRQKVPQPVDVIAIVRKLRTVLAHPSVKRDMSASQQMAALVVAPCLECVSLNVRASTRIANWGM